MEVKFRISNGSCYQYLLDGRMMEKDGARLEGIKETIEVEILSYAF